MMDTILWSDGRRTVTQTGPDKVRITIDTKQYHDIRVGMVAGSPQNTPGMVAALEAKGYNADDYVTLRISGGIIAIPTEAWAVVQAIPKSAREQYHDACVTLASARDSRYNADQRAIEQAGESDIYRKPDAKYEMAIDEASARVDEIAAANPEMIAEMKEERRASIERHFWD